MYDDRKNSKRKSNFVERQQRMHDFLVISAQSIKIQRYGSDAYATFNFFMKWQNIGGFITVRLDNSAVSPLSDLRLLRTVLFVPTKTSFISPLKIDTFPL